MKGIKITVLSLGVMICGQAMAQEKQHDHDPEKVFAHLDTNSDGSLDKAEFKVGAEKRAENKDKEIDIDKQFAKTDTNSDGLISKEEFLARKDEMKAHHDAKNQEKQ